MSWEGKERRSVRFRRKKSETRILTSLLNDGSHRLGLGPPLRLLDSLVSTGVSSDGGHDSEVVVGEDLLHLLNDSKVSKHVSTRRRVEEICEQEGLARNKMKRWTNPTETMFPRFSRTDAIFFAPSMDFWKGTPGEQE